MQPPHAVGRSKPNPFRCFKTSPEIIRLAVMVHVRFPLSLRNAEGLLHERGIEVSHETIRSWWRRFNQERSLSRRDIFKTNRAAARTEWRQPGAA